jgi:uncharacterized integral membrane protein
LVALVVIVVLLVVFILQNQAPSPIRFLWWNPSMPTIVLLLVTFALGLVAGWISAAVGKRRPGRVEKESKEADTAGT